MEDNKKNYILFFADSIFFVNAMTFLSVNAVIIYFLNVLGASVFQISLASALVSVGAFISQPIFVRLAMKLKFKIKVFCKILFAQRIFFLASIAFIPLFAISNPKLMTILFLICWGIFNFFTGSYSPFFMSLLSKMIEENERGRLLGFGSAAGNIIAIGAAYIIGILLKNVPFPYNYTYIFAIGAIILIFDAVDFLFMKEPPDISNVNEDMSYVKYVKAIPSALKDNIKIAKIIAGNSLIVISCAGLTYSTLYAIRIFNAKAEQIALFTAIAVIINIIGNIIFGLITDKHGHSLVMQIASICGAASGIAMLLFYNIYAAFAAFALSNFCSCGYNLNCSIFIIKNCKRERVPMYISINVMITLVISSTVMLLSGYIVDKISFTPVFVMISIAGVCAFLMYYSLRETSME